MAGENIFLTNIQRFSLHDGPGIRTTVFLKGCPLHCPWCSNPENVYGNDGKYYTPEKLLRGILRDKIFYDGDIRGGVTFSGGEPLLQIDGLVPVLEALKSENVHTSVETCLYVPWKNLDTAMKYIDLFHVDMKIMNAEGALRILGGDYGLYLSNLDALMKVRNDVIVRIPVIGGYTDSAGNIESVKKILAQYAGSIQRADLIKGHNLGASKYRKLGLNEPCYTGVSDELMLKYERDISGLGFPAEICRI